DQERNRFLRLFLLNRTVLVAGQYFPMACAVSGAPIGFKGCDKFPNNLSFTDDQTKFATRIQLDCTQALAADEGLAAVANNRASVKAHPGQFVKCDPGAVAEFANDADFDAR